MKRMWARVGIEFCFDTQEEYDDFLNIMRTNDVDAELLLIKKLAQKIMLRGETYFPEQGCFGDDTTDNVEQLSFIF